VVAATAAAVAVTSPIDNCMITRAVDQAGKNALTSNAASCAYATISVTCAW
jgi:hypothetical protein